MASWRSMTKIAEEGSGATSQRHGSADPDPYQNVTDPQHCGSYKSNVELTLHCVPFLSLYFLTKCPNFIKNLTIGLAYFLPTCGPSGLLQAFFWMLLQAFIWMLLQVLLLLLQVAEAYGCARERGEQTPGLPRVRQTVPHQKAGQYWQLVPVPVPKDVKGTYVSVLIMLLVYFGVLTFSANANTNNNKRNTSLCDRDVIFLVDAFCARVF